MLNYYRNRKKKTLPVLKTDKDLEAEGLARLSLDLPSFQISEEPESTIETDPQLSKANSGSSTPSVHRPRIDNAHLLNRHSIGFDVPGAVHTIMTPSKYNNNIHVT